MNNQPYDVVVAGAGPAGLVAAIQAARAGARTLLVEKSGMLGGTPVLNEVNLPGLFHAWGRQVIAGIGWEWVETAMKEAGQTMPDFSRYKELRHPKLQIPVNRAFFACIADRLAMESGMDILLHTMPAEVGRESGLEWRLRLCCKEGLKEVCAKVLVDCTGDANLVRQAGGKLLRRTTHQPGTLMMKSSGYDCSLLDEDAIERAYQEALERKEIEAADLHGHPACAFLKRRGDNAMHVTNIDAETSAGKTEAELKARQAMYRIIKFYRSAPGLEHFEISHFAAECGIRETALIDGETCITTKDYIHGRVYRDSVCFSFYPIDLHLDNGKGIDIRPLQEGIIPTIPLRALLPKGTTHLIVAGRMACGEREAHSAYRVQASCMAMGQAAGAAAALASRRNVDIRELQIQEIHKLLKEHRAIVPDLSEAV